MFLWLLQRFGHLFEQVAARTTGDSRVFLTARTAAASITAFLMTLVLGPMAIRWLKKRFRERIVSDSATLNELHADKKDTPTMGGLFVMGAILVSSLLWCDLNSPLVWTGLFIVLLFTSIGAWDDWVKQRTDRNGLAARQKLGLQLMVSVAAAVMLFQILKTQPFGTDLVWPLGNAALPLGAFFVVWATLVMVGASNSVNLTDGLDGLAAGCTISCGTAFAILTYLSGHSVISDYLSIPYVPGCGELTIMLGALVGAALGFLWFNCHPAEVFLGDAGSLPIGGLLAVAALASRQELLLVVIGGVFVVETLSVMLQVAWYRRTGRRLIRCSPLHNHFVFRGDNETKIVTRFWIAAILLAIVGLASLKLR